MVKFRVRSSVIWLVLLSFVLASCATPTATPAPVLATAEPAATPVPPTPTVVPTPTAVPAPHIQNVMFSTKADLTDAIGQDGTFMAGPAALYFSMDQADIPAASSLSLELKRDGIVVLSKSTPWTAPAANTYSQALLTDAHLLIPGAYKLTVKLANQSVEGRFKIDSAGAAGAALLTENFDDNQLGWMEHSDKTWSARIENGQLTLTSLFANQAAYSGLPINLKDFDLTVEVSATQVSPQSYYSVIFRSSNAGSYIFTLFPDGGFAVDLSAVTTSKGFQPLIDLQRSSAIHRGVSTNRLRIVAKGQKFAFYINDGLVGSITDNKLPSGTIAFAVDNPKTAGASAAFDHLLVTYPAGEVEVLPTKAAPQGTPVPRPTAKPATPPLATVIQQTIDNAQGFKSALSSGGESCTEFFKQYNGIINAPVFDVTNQSPAIQGAYGLYRQAINLAASKSGVFNDICSKGGGVIGKLDWQVAFKLMDEAVNLLYQAAGMLQ